MSIAHLDRAFQLIDSHQALADFFGPRSIELLRKAEAALGLTFPPTFRRFALRYGAGFFGTEEFYGLTTDNFDHASVPNGVWLTLRQRREFQLPHAMILIYTTYEYFDCAIDTSRASEHGEHPVVELIPGEDLTSPRVVAPDFGYFLLEQVQHAISLGHMEPRNAVRE